MHQMNLRGEHMDINTHVIKVGIYKDKTIKEIENARDQIEFLSWYSLQLNELELIKEINTYLKMILFSKKLNELKSILTTFYDEKVKDKPLDSFKQTHLDYLSLKHTGKTIKEIESDSDIPALELIIKKTIESYH